MKPYLKLMRIDQWSKNAFVFLPLVFSGNIFHAQFFLESLFACIVFSLASSSVYIFNDYIDREADRRHPDKKHRPLASGAVRPAQAFALFAGILMAAILLVVCGWSFFRMGGFYFVIVTAAYWGIHILYSIKLKHVAIVDIFVVALGFVLRVLAGGTATGIPVTQWMILLSFSLALILIIGKRREELIRFSTNPEKNREALAGYNIRLTDVLLSISCTLAVICYLMFSLAPETMEKFHPRIFYTILFVIFGFMRYLQQTLVYNRAESPATMVYKDRYILATLVLWFSIFLLQIYVK